MPLRKDETMNELNILTPETREWLEKFEQLKGRKLRVLHVGNIAANGFLNAKFLRRVGVEADVLCNDYYHIMGYPEWEELFIQDDYQQDILPRFSANDKRNYQRPKWFVQGPINDCFAYLHAKNAGNKEEAERIWNQLNDFLFTEFALFSTRIAFRQKLKKTLIKTRRASVFMMRGGWRFCDYMFFRRFSVLQPVKQRIKTVCYTYLGRLETKIKAFINQTPIPPTDMHNELQEFVQNLNNKYLQTFPDRQFQLDPSDFEHYYRHKENWQKLANYYDVIQFYGTHPIFGLLFADKPYLGFEHGTLRTFTSDTTALDALTALSYRYAQHVFITNGDCLEYAEKLKMNNFSPMIHPIDVEQHREYEDKRIQHLRAFYKADVLLFCPLRHDWEVKGTDRHIRALPYINKLVSGKVVLVMTNWGADLERSRVLAKSLGVDEQIHWVSPLCRLKMIEMIQASDVVLDQTILPCFGSTAPQSLACGTPTIMSYKPEVTQWLIKDPAPLICASTELEIAEGILQALNKEWLLDFKQKAAHWIDTYHSSTVAISQQLHVYKNFLAD